MDWQSLLFRFDGRINRAKYWLVVLITFITAIVAMTIAIILTGTLEGDTGFLAAVVVCLALMAFCIWIGVATAIKRLHDREKSGWWLLLFYLVPSVLNGVSSVTDNPGGLLLAAVGFAISLWGFVELGCLKGTTGPNAYGPDPLPPEAAA
ncbi:DUF805 domain-containing protein [Bradyrhizobium sp. LHD-71]|uniref:DUF805 domain-containing protein n=1 Tax=Bradyrhizobium sp. LHD-71 TaxID=3072141 RepID=UPI00280CBA43|nr:DUF805 domain-containing protein [Bradyrhizobium sp. LHD-71]MDQ8727255.1 DUF805 domain-containing protein [Bradyrhizobium sp. LHD-71]